MYITLNIRKLIYQIIYRFFYGVCRQEAICFVYGPGSKLYSNLAPVQAIAERRFPVHVVADGKDSCFSALKKLACSKVLLLDQTNKYVSNITLGRETICIQCWHAGGAYKKMGFDAKRSGFSQSEEEKRIARVHKNIHYFVCSSEYVADIYAHAFHLPRQKMLTFGLPRMDSVLAQAADSEQTEESVILYAPTFRTGSDGRYMPVLPDVEFLRRFFKDVSNIRFAFRSHPTVAHVQVSPGWENWSFMPQSEALARASVLITDFSSVFFDFLVYNRPVIFYLHDIPSYTAAERELYFEPAQYFPETVCEDTEQLGLVLRKFLKRKMDYSAFWNMEMGACDGHSAQRLFSFIEQLIVGTIS